MNELERQEKLHQELENELDNIFSKLYQIRDILDNEEEGYGLTPELLHIRKVVDRTINDSIA